MLTKLKKTAGALALLACASAVLAAPRAESALECGVAADMAIVARSLAQEEVQRPQATKIMTRIYDVTDSQRGKELMQEILDAAYHKNDTSQAFAEELFAACIKSGGDMNQVLGQRS